MDVFQEIPDGLVVLHTKGVFRQAALFFRGRFVYAKHGSGFVKLYAGGGTSVPTISWKDIDAGLAIIAEDKFYLVRSPNPQISSQKLVQIPAE